MTTDFVNFIVSVFFSDRLRWWVHLYNVIITIILLYAYVYHNGRPSRVVFFSDRPMQIVNNSAWHVC